MKRTTNGEKRNGLFWKIFLLCISVLLGAKLIFDYHGFWNLFKSIGSSFVSVLSYILIGFIIAYVLDSFVCLLTDRVLRRWKSRPKLKRGICIALAYLTFLGVLSFIIFLLVPYISDTVKKLTSDIPSLVDQTIALYNQFLSGGLIKLPDAVYARIDVIVHEVFQWMTEILTASKITNILTATTTVIINAVLGIIMSVYMLIEKQGATAVAANIVDAVFSPRISRKIKWAAGETNKIFSHYFSGKIWQAFLVTTLSMIVFAVARVPYPMLFAVVVGIFNMIPYIGPWIGALPVILICLAKDFWKGVTAVICVLIIQAIDNWIISPKVVGNKMGISPLAVLIGLCIGGRLFGIPGMIVGDVMAALVKVFFYDNFIRKKLNKRAEQKAAADAADNGAPPPEPGAAEAAGTPEAPEETPAPDSEEQPSEEQPPVEQTAD